MAKREKTGRPPAFQFYAKDWISSKKVRMLSPLQRGYYIQLLAEAWDSTPIGTLPNDPEMLRKLACEPSQEEWAKHSPAVIEIFKKIRGNLLASTRLIKERDKQIERKSKCKMAGHISASNRKQKKLAGNKRSTDVQQEGQQKANSSSSSSISSSTVNTNTKSKPSPTAIEIVPAILEVSSPEETRILPEDGRHSRIRAMVKNAWANHNGGVDCPWDGSEGKQLKLLLRATPKWHDSQFAQCLANMYGSTGFAVGTRPREFLPRLPKYLHGPLNEFNREQGNGNGTSKGDRRAADISKTTREIFGGDGIVSGNTPARLPDKAAAAGVGAMAGHAQRLQLPGVQSGHDAPDSKPAKV